MMKRDKYYVVEDNRMYDTDRPPCHAPVCRGDHCDESARNREELGSQTYIMLLM